jgi:uncharacterized protein (TIGR00296 family)
MFNSKEGATLVRVARTAVEKLLENRGLRLRNPEKTKVSKLNEKHGLFVTLKKYGSNDLRGCIGFISPIQVYEGVQEAAICAAFKDPRFPPLRKDESGSVIFEVSVMTEPTLVSDKSLAGRKKKIKIGRDGLIISNGPCSGLLLPQVPVEQKWDIVEFLNNLCYKAGMETEFLEDDNTNIWKFQCQIFAEHEPNGTVYEIKMG